VPWDPVRDLLTMQERLETLFGRTSTGWMPAVDLAELPDAYVLSIELPGFRREDVQIEYGEPTLTIRGTRPPLDCCPERYQQFERGQGEFARTFHFDLPVRGDAIAAEITDGVLMVTIPKVSGTRQRIDVA